MRKPLVSVCIPAYNSSDYIADTMESILNQTYKNLELVVVDDCSKDNTVEIVETIAARDPRVRLVKNEKNLGMTGNWTKAVQETKGEFVKLICADDILFPKSIEKELTACLKHPEVTLVITDSSLIDEQGTRTAKYGKFPIGGVHEGKLIAKLSLVLWSFFGPPVGAFFPRTSFDKVGGSFDPQFPFILDFDMWLRMSYLGKVYVIKKELNGFRTRNDSNTGELINKDRKTYNDEHRAMVEKHNRLGYIHINPVEAAIMMTIRHIRNEMIQIFLRLKAGKQRNPGK